MAEDDGRVRRVHVGPRAVNLVRRRRPVPDQIGQSPQPFLVTLPAARRPDRRAQVIAALAIREPGIELAPVEPGGRAEHVVAEQLPAALAAYRGVAVRPAADRAQLVSRRDAAGLGRAHANAR